MSLELAAKHLAAQGRGKDRNLVHMTDREVAGLQALAMAQGGSLTINPETGLPEAGFLDSLLPSIIGFGASALTGGAINPMTIGLLTGVGTAAISGDLSKGLMAGLGAYGGAGLGAGLIGAGTPGGTVLGEAAGLGTPAQPMFTQTPVAQAAQAAQSAPFDLSSMGTVGGGATQALPNALTAPTYSGQIMPATPAVQAAQAVPTVTPTPEIAMPPASELNAQGVARLARQSTAPVTMPPVGETMKASLGAVAKNPMDFMTKENAMYGLAAAAPMLMAAPETTEPEKDTEQYKYIYDPGRVADPESTRMGGPSSELTYFRPRYTRTAASGGLMALADGGQITMTGTFSTEGGNSSSGIPLPSNSNQTPLFSGQNSALPQRPTYEQYMAQRNPMQHNVPLSREQYNSMPNLGAMIQPNTAPISFSGSGGIGGQLFAEGGEVDNEVIEYEYDPLTKTYKKKVAPVAAGAVAPITSSTTSGSSTMTPLSKEQEAYLDWEANTAEGNAARDNRMQNISNAISLAMPGASLFNALSGKPTPLPSLQAIFGTPDAYRQYQAAVASGARPAAVGPTYSGYVTDSSGNVVRSGDGSPVSYGESGGWANTAADNSNRSDPGAVGSIADTAGDKAGGRIGDKPHHKPQQGRFLEGPGDGVSDSIPATINGTQPARLADGEFVIPARIVSELGNGSSKAGARKLYAMMDRIQKARSKTTGKGRVAANTKAEKYLPA